MIGSNEAWRINIPVQQLRDRGYDGAEQFREGVLRRIGEELSIHPDTGDQFETKKPKAGAKVIITAVGFVNANDSKDRSHIALGVGTIGLYRFVAGTAKISLRRLSLLTEIPPHWRTMPHPGIGGNLKAVDVREYARLAAMV